MNFLDGYKSYIVAAAIALTTGAFALGLIDKTIATLIFGLLGAGGVVALKSAIKKAEK